MNIVNRNPSIIMTQFKGIELGEAFQYQDSFYIKMSKDSALKLGTNIVVSIYENEYVIKREIEIVVK